MVLSIDLFRPDKGGDPEKMRQNQINRYKDPRLVDQIVEKDEEWRKLRHHGDGLNKAKNVCSKTIGEKMKKKEPQGDNETLPSEITSSNLIELSPEKLKEFTVVQIKHLVKLIDQEIEKNDSKLTALEQERNEALKEMGRRFFEISK